MLLDGKLIAQQANGIVRTKWGKTNQSKLW
jgi:hypothetical protein